MLTTIQRLLQLLHFHMETLGVIQAMQKGEFLAFLDLAEAYFHIPIREDQQCFLCFTLLRVLPYGPTDLLQNHGDGSAAS